MDILVSFIKNILYTRESERKQNDVIMSIRFFLLLRLNDHKPIENK
jgi:hypothetical protein